MVARKGKVTKLSGLERRLDRRQQIIDDVFGAVFRLSGFQEPAQVKKIISGGDDRSFDITTAAVLGESGGSAQVVA